MTYPLETLMAWVDGELPPEEADAIARAAETDPAVAEAIAALQASRLPYQAAWRATRETPMPAELRDKVEQLCRVSAADSAAPSTDDRAAPWSRWAMAATVLLAVCIGYAGGHWIPVTAFGTESDAPVAGDDAVVRWARLVADYQSLYVPETVAGVSDGARNVDGLRAEFVRRTGRSLAVPDLAGHGYRFVRAQQLGYAGQPLIQLVYIDDRKRLIALCFMPDLGPDLALAEFEHRGLRTASWRDRGQRFVLVGHATETGLPAIRDEAMKAWRVAL